MVQLNYEVKHIRKNEFSRPAYDLLKIQAIVIHWTANSGADADAHFNYFDKTIIQLKRYAGAHIFVDKDKTLELIPLNEGAFGANDGGNASLKLPTLRASDKRYPTRTGDGNANLLTIHVEMCVEKDGSIHPDTVERTRLVVKMLQDKFPQLKDTKNRVVRHFDITGKNCPKPFVEDEKKWNAFLESIDQPIEEESNESLKIQTGGLRPENCKELAEYLIDKNWYAKFKFDGKGNPIAVTGGLNPSMRKEFEAWLKERNWWYKVIK